MSNKSKLSHHQAATKAAPTKFKAEESNPLLFSNRIRNPAISDQQRKDMVIRWALNFKSLRGQLKGA